VKTVLRALKSPCGALRGSKNRTDCKGHAMQFTYAACRMFRHFYLIRQHLRLCVQLLLVDLLQITCAWAQTTQWTDNSRCALRLVG
jgi:hypothetical protein